ncbi:hypothetical protein PM082_017765 [Marasmius tenuissimus]|nr:hypothetical protein PM082_017765 [Marasmius tenuissimus]
MEKPTMSQKRSQSPTTLPGLHETFINFGSGDEALAAFKANLSLLPPLFSINGGTSLLGPVAKLHSPNIRYSYYSYRESRYMAKLGDCEKYLNHSLLLEGINQLPTPFNREDQSIVRKYKDFFASYGTHVVTAVEYGSIFQLQAWGSNENPEVNEAWIEDVKANYEGLPSGGEYDPRIKKTEQYKAYWDLKFAGAGCVGGEPPLAHTLLTEQTYRALQEWAKTGAKNAEATIFSLSELWRLMEDSSEGEIVRYAHDIHEAYEWLLNNDD